jgi:uncharacterized membrane protein YgcG
MAKWKQDSSGNWKKNSSIKKNYTIVNGKKVEHSASSTKTAPATSNDTWNKDTVSLEEAKQQTKDVERGIINLDTGATSIVDTPTTTVSLAEASSVSSSESANRVLASESTNSLLGGTVTESYVIDGDKVTKTTETVELHNDLSTIKVGGPIKSAAQLGKVTKKKTVTRSWSNPFYTKPVDLSNVPDTKQGTTKTLTGEQADRIKTLLGTENKPSGTGQEGTISLKPGEQPKESIIEAAVFGVKTGTVSDNTISHNSMLINQEGASKRIYESGLSLAEKLRNVGNKAVDKGTDTVITANKHNPLSIVPQSTLEGIAPVANKFVKGAVVNTGAGLIQGAAGVPGAIEIGVKNPAALGGALIVGTGVMIGATVKGLKEDPATTLGELTGMYLVGKGSGKAVNKIGDEMRTRGRIEVPVETLAQEKVITGAVTFPTVPKGTPVSSVLADFKQTANLHPQPEILKQMGGEYGVHVSPGELGKKSITRVGTSEAPGLYTGPDASLHFAGLNKQKYKLLGFEKDSAPTVNFMQMKGTKRLPKSLRSDSKGAYDFTLNKAKKGTGYTTAKMESGLKVASMEPELVIPPGTEYALNANASGFYTKFKGRKLPVNVYERVKNPLGTKKAVADTVKGEKGRVYRESDYSGMNERILLSDRDIAALGSRSKVNSSSSSKVPSSSKISNLLKPSLPASLSSSRKSTKSSGISSISSLKSPLSSRKSGSKGSSSGSKKSGSSGSSSSGGSGYSGTSGSGDTFVSSSYPLTWKWNSGGSSSPVVVVSPKPKSQGRRKKSGKYGVDRKIAENKFKNIWELV